MEQQTDATMAPPVAPAPSAPIAVASRAFGDDYPQHVFRGRIRWAGVLLLLATAFYVPWMLSALDGHTRWLSWPFAVANGFSIAYAALAVFNAWNRWVPERRPVAHGVEPLVGVLIPTCGEAVPMILRTVLSVLEQDWPADRLAIIVSDDAHDAELELALRGLPVTYLRPPLRYAPGRDGAAKSGNLNCALSLLDHLHPDVTVVETRDADDEVGSNGFLREAVGQLLADDALAYVQTIKEAQVGAGDPFNNRESMFYRGQMISRNAANAVFPCGSGLVWRRAALSDIGEFPTWNLVEDIQSGVEALRRGWRGLYLPIVGAVGQHSPQDIPNVYKQRGTWAIDTVRLLIWRPQKGLDLRQRAHFLEMLCFYFNAFTTLVYVPSIAFALVGFTPLTASASDYAVHIGPLVLATEIWLLVLNHPYNDRRQRQRHRFRALWHQRVIVAGLAPIYMKASLQAVLGGRRRKPVYKVTRKQDDLRWHWRHTLPQGTAVLAVLVVGITAALLGRLPSLTLLAGVIYWGGLNIVLLTSFVSRGWYGLTLAKRRLADVHLDAAAQPGPAAAPQDAA